MTKEEVTKALRIITSVYPNAYKDKAMLRDAIETWAVIFMNDPAEQINAAIYIYINQPHEYAPKPGQLRDIIYNQMHRDELSEADAWALVAKAIRNGTYGAEDEFNKLPETVQKAIGSPQYLRDLAMSEDLNTSVESSNFFKRYRVIMERQKNDSAIPEAINAIMEKAGVALIEGGKK